ncbi:NusG domain II-containing protein [Treponema pectinovorum]|uniref:NusG domain II-containing protein n=1 Tax=Treponema pectinovorum TaxID=164 RepID=UPI00164D0734|nr:NusG domain II-containing protein [Treponema pectinovorum]
MKLLDVIFFIIIFFTASYFTLLIFKGKHTDSVLIKTQSKTYEIPLTKEQRIYKVQGALGITEIQIKDYKVKVLSSACPNKNCIRAGKSDLIICAPNKVMIQVLKDNSKKIIHRTKKTKEHFDAVTQ